MAAGKMTVRMPLARWSLFRAGAQILAFIATLVLLVGVSA